MLLVQNQQTTNTDACGLTEEDALRTAEDLAAKAKAKAKVDSEAKTHPAPENPPVRYAAAPGSVAGGGPNADKPASGRKQKPPPPETSGNSQSRDPALGKTEEKEREESPFPARTEGSRERTEHVSRNITFKSPREGEDSLLRDDTAASGGGPNTNTTESASGRKQVSHKSYKSPREECNEEHVLLRGEIARLLSTVRYTHFTSFTSTKVQLSPAPPCCAL
jgi:hypothetical protein